MVTKAEKPIEKKVVSKSKSKAKTAKPTLKINANTTKEPIVNTRKETIKKETSKIIASKHSIKPDIVKKVNVSKKRSLCLNVGKSKETVTNETVETSPILERNTENAHVTTKKVTNAISQTNKEPKVISNITSGTSIIVTNSTPTVTKKDTSINQNSSFFYEPSIFKKFEIAVTDSSNDDISYYDAPVDNETYNSIQSEMTTSINNVITEIEDTNSSLIDDIDDEYAISNDDIKDNCDIVDDSEAQAQTSNENSVSDVVSETDNLVKENIDNESEDNNNTDAVNIETTETEESTICSPNTDIDDYYDTEVSPDIVSMLKDIETAYETIIENSSSTDTNSSSKLTNIVNFSNNTYKKEETYNKTETCDSYDETDEAISHMSYDYYNDLEINSNYNNYYVKENINNKTEYTSIKTENILEKEIADNIVPVLDIPEIDNNNSNKVFDVSNKINADSISFSGFKKPTSNIFKKFSFEETCLNNQLVDEVEKNVTPTSTNKNSENTYLSNNITNTVENFDTSITPPISNLEGSITSNTSLTTPTIETNAVPVATDLDNAVNEDLSTNYYNNIITPSTSTNETIPNTISEPINDSIGNNDVDNIEKLIESILTEKLQAKNYVVDEKVKQELLAEVLSALNNTTYNKNITSDIETQKKSFNNIDVSSKTDQVNNYEENLETLNAELYQDEITKNQSLDITDIPEIDFNINDIVDMELNGAVVNDETVNIGIDEGTVANININNNNSLEENIIDTNNLQIVDNTSDPLDPTSDLFKVMDSLSDIISQLENSISDEEQVEEVATNTDTTVYSSIYEPNTLLISEETQKVYLPYTVKEVKTKLNNSDYKNFDEVIENEYTVPLANYKNPVSSRFQEAYNLMKEKENSSVRAALDLALDLMFTSNLNPAIITACKNVKQLNNYLEYLYNDETNKFTDFKIVYKISSKENNN